MAQIKKLKWERYEQSIYRRSTKYESGDYRIDAPNGLNHGRYELFYKGESLGFYMTLNVAKWKANQENEERLS